MRLPLCNINRMCDIQHICQLAMRLVSARSSKHTGASVFHEPDDLRICAGPVKPGAMGFDSPGSPVEPGPASYLVEQLDRVLFRDDSGARAVQCFLNEIGLKWLVDGGVGTDREESLRVLAADLSTCREIYETGYIHFEREDYTKAASYFLLSLTHQATRNGGYIALAACASREGFFQSSYSLALAAIEIDALHPRSHLIAGSCAWHLKDKRKAKYHFAAANRLSRRCTSYRPEQRTAQRLLLTIQFS